MTKQVRKGSKENPLKSTDLENINKRAFIINDATIKDDICNYLYEVTGGIGIGDEHSVKGTGVIEDDMREAFGKLNVHLAAIDEVFKHSKIDIENIDELHVHELTALFRVKSFKIKKSKGYESISLKGEKYVSSAGGWMLITSPEVPLDNLSSYKWWNELKTVSDLCREEVALYKEGKYTPVKEEMEIADNKQSNLFDGQNGEMIDENLMDSKLD